MRTSPSRIFFATTRQCGDFFPPPSPPPSPHPRRRRTGLIHSICTPTSRDEWTSRAFSRYYARPGTSRYERTSTSRDDRTLTHWRARTTGRRRPGTTGRRRPGTTGRRAGTTDEPGLQRSSRAFNGRAGPLLVEPGRNIRGSSRDVDGRAGPFRGSFSSRAGT